MQRVYLDTIDNRLNGSAAATDEIRALLRGELRVIDQQIAAALPAATDTATRRHLQDVRASIGTTLDPRALRAAGAPAGTGRGNAAVDDTGRVLALVPSERYDYDNDPFLAVSDACWLAPEIR